MIAQFYTALFVILLFYPRPWSTLVNPVLAYRCIPNVENFFGAYIAAPVIILLYIIWKTYSWFAVPSHRPMFIPVKDIDVYTGMREDQRRLSVDAIQVGRQQAKTAKGVLKNVAGALF